jgi:hypothetical protein
MVDPSVKETLAFVGSQFDSVEHPAALMGVTGTSLPSQKKGTMRLLQSVTFEGDKCRGMGTMERYMACQCQPLQITVAQSSTSNGE